MPSDDLAAKVDWLRSRLPEPDRSTTLPNGQVVSDMIHLETILVGDGGGYTYQISLESLAAMLPALPATQGPLPDNVMAMLKEVASEKLAAKLDEFRKKGHL